MAAFANKLGVAFISSKDEGFDRPITSINFLGCSLHTSPKVYITPTDEKLTYI